MTRTIRLESDWGLHPFYTQDEPDAPFDLTDTETFQAMYALPDVVISTLLAWDRLYQDHLDWDDPASTRWPDEASYDRYVAEGRAAARLLRRHLPTDVCIRYVADGNVAAEHF